MRLPLPTPLAAVEVADSARRGVPRVVLVAAGEPPVLGPGGEGLPEDVSAQAGVTRRVDDRWVLGVGDGTAAQWRRAGAALARALGEDGTTPSCDVLLPEDADAEAVRGFVLGAVLGDYRFKVTEQPTPERVRSYRLVVSDPGYTEVLAEEARRAHVLASATALNRDLANAPSNVKDPAWLASTAAKLARAVPGLDAVVRDEKWLAARGFGGVLAVGGGSARPPRLLELSWRGGDGPHLVLVGKGITFDTGGISIKPADGMHLMRTDMSGGAAVIAALIAVARRGLPLRVTGLVPCAENHVSGSAYRPGDVVRHFGGTTSEIGNTDAEGRLVLADAMAYAVRELAPDLMVDVATLTGAMKVSLGLRTGGFFTGSDELARRVVEAGQRVGEAWWRMPLLEEHVDDVRGELADLKQAPGGPGAITAALFLREFTGGLPWAHLDIAGPARAEKPYDEVAPGATGFAARTLVELAETYTR
ncbi:leucyl aminopeptidase [Saccharothrix coeruleofusca]|uniref:Probable cytosol aminopeptidase n=1 Tax=Saccharothrix coeruleofusca TaxID=33919 RepID=A0A918EDU9_9PSEU|nr:leucyl aminopeptidase family protein [Saccharothrix coeruleofusca]GGP60747.1 leucyl aminopeptidase [Saccharothrix coeruleofusca]